MARVVSASRADLSISRGEDYRAGRGGISKIERYELVSMVLEMEQENSTAVAIAAKCNQELRARPGDRTYYSITHDNVWHFLNRIKKEKKKTLEERLAKELKNYEDPVTRVHRLCNRIELEINAIQKQRTPDNELPFVKINAFKELVGSLTTALNLLSNVTGKLQPPVSIQVLYQNTQAFVDSVIANEQLSKEARQEVLQLIDQHLLSEQLLKALETTATQIK